MESLEADTAFTNVGSFQASWREGVQNSFKAPSHRFLIGNYPSISLPNSALAKIFEDDVWFFPTRAKLEKEQGKVNPKFSAEGMRKFKTERAFPSRKKLCKKILFISTFIIKLIKIIFQSLTTIKTVSDPKLVS